MEHLRRWFRGPEGPCNRTWTETATTEPSTNFSISIIVTAPVTVSADQSVGLRVWSTAAGTNAEEAGVAWSDVPLAISLRSLLPTPMLWP